MVSTNEECNAAASVEVVQQPAVDATAAVGEIKAMITEEEFEKAQKTFQQGKKNLLLNKYDESVNNIEEACKAYSAKYGELDPQCAEVYFFFGRALLELARVENNVLGNALNGVPEDTGPINDSRYGNPDEVAEEEKEDIADKVIDAMCENNEAAEQNGAAKEPTEQPTEPAAASAEAEKKEENGETAVAAEPKAEGAEEKKEGEENGENEEEGGDEEGEDDEQDEDISKNEANDAAGDDAAAEGGDSEDISNLQRSWEMFELAKVIYQKNFGDDASFKNKRIAECLLKLGEIGIEQELYEQAINDIRESIRLQEDEKSERDERMLAESYYQLGLAQQFNNLFPEANESYQRSINILQIRVEKLRGKLISLESTGTEGGISAEDIQLEKNTINDEIAEIELLLPELNGKIEEVNEQGQQSLNLIKEAKECFVNSIGAGSQGESAGFNKASNGTAGSQDCKDITSLMKSKRKISASDELGQKKSRLSGGNENGINGSAEPAEVQPEPAANEAPMEATPAPEPVPAAGDENKE